MSSHSSTLTPSQKALLPKDKHDSAAIAHLSTLPESTIAPLVSELLTWIQDINWPIAALAASFLLKYPHLLVVPVQGILLGSDGVEAQLPGLSCGRDAARAAAGVETGCGAYCGEFDRGREG
ncbi:hypothetical protein LARI1_G006604, partial [Lachnellula arida]